MARLAGIVHGVVVQITTESSEPADSWTGNFTQIMGEFRSWYSTSASARAVRSTGLHITGLEPRKRRPDMSTLWNSPTMAASDEKSMVA